MSTDKTPKPESGESVTEPMARAAYLAMPAPRSLRRLRADMMQRHGRAPGKSTLEVWSKKHSWQALAREHDQTVAQGAAAIVAKKQARTAAERAEWLNDLGEQLVQEGVRLAREGDPAALVRAGIEAMKYAEVLTGGVSDRTGTVIDDPQAVAKAEADRIRGLIARARGAVVNGNGLAVNGRAKVVNGNGHAGNGHGEPAEH